MYKLIRKNIIFSILFNRGKRRENIAEYSQALDYFYLALTLKPGSIKTYKAIARICRKNKTCLNGIDFLNKGCVRYFDNSELYAIKADLYRKIRDFNNAINEFDNAIKFNGENWEYYVERGKLKVQNGDIQGAINDFNGAININPKSANLYSLRAFYYFQRKNYINAAQDYEKAISLNPNKWHYYYMLASMQQLLGLIEESQKNFQKAKHLALIEKKSQ